MLLLSRSVGGRRREGGAFTRRPHMSAAGRGWGIAATPPALAEDREVRSEPRGKRSAAGGRAQRAARRCPTLAPPPPSSTAAPVEHRQRPRVEDRRRPPVEHRQRRPPVVDSSRNG